MSATNTMLNRNLIVNESVEVHASVERVWEVLTRPEIIQEYLFGTQTTTDWQAGSEIVFEGVFGEHRYRDKGTILENLPRRKLCYSYWSGFSGLADQPENYAIVTYLLEPAGDNVRFTWRQEGYPDENRYQHSREGMKDFLHQIKVIAERS